MKLTISLILCSIFLLTTNFSIHALQNIHVRGTRTGDPVDFNANVNVSGSVEAPLTVHLPTATQHALIRLACEASAIGYGYGFIASGTRDLMGDSSKPTQPVEARLEEGLRKRTSVITDIPSIQTHYASLGSDTLLYVDDEDNDDEQPKKSRCTCFSRLVSSPGLRKIVTGLCFIASALSVEFFQK
jgi:hypothetical protein